MHAHAPRPVRPRSADTNTIRPSAARPLALGHRSILQASLRMSSVGDHYEEEAERTADRIMRMSDPTVLQRRPCACGGTCPTCEAKAAIQPKRVSAPASGNAGVAADDLPAVVARGTQGSGRPLDSDTRRFMESRFGHDFGTVRIHDDGNAAESAHAINALAYTVGNRIVFGHGGYAPQTEGGRHLIAHELTHVVQQSHAGPLESGDAVAQSSSHAPAAVQCSCADGACESCAGGRKDLWVTVFFRRRATQDTMTKLRAEINGAKAILANCCLNLKFDFNWTLLAGGGSLPAFTGDPAGTWHYTNDEQALGEGTTFSGARGIPMLLVDDVPLSGGGITVDPRFDTTYTGKSYFAIGINQTTTPNPNCNHIAHELWHVGSGLSAHDPANGTVTSCTGSSVTLNYCNGLRALA